jgi:type III secretion system (T3SS) SseB-like protein
VPSLHAAEPLFPDDDGAADPAVLAALTAYDAGRGSEHAALNALASSRLLVPVVAVLTEEAGEDSEAAGDIGAARDVEAAGDVEAAEDSGADGAAEGSGPGAGLRQEKTTEMAMPTLIGRDGRIAVLAFTSLDALTRWRPDARPVAVPAARAWQAGAEEASAVVIDVAGPVPVTVEGARLAALAAGRPAPLPHQDPDVLAALHAALGGEPLIVQASLTTPDQRAGWEYGPRPEDLPDLAAPSAPDLSTLGVDLLASVNGASANGAGDGAGDAAQDAPDPDSAAQETGPQETAPEEPAAQAAPAPGGAGEDTADLALQVTLADGCDPAAATAAVRRVAEALLTATGGRLRRGMEISVAPPRRAPRAR